MNEKLLQLLIKSYNATIQAEGTDFLYKSSESQDLAHLVEDYIDDRDENLFYNN